jgi:hypothetical protein
MRLRTALSASLLLGCSRPTTESKATQNGTPPTATATAPAANDAGPTFVVRIHRYGGAPPDLNHTLEVAPDGSAHLTGHDGLWCRGKKGPQGGTPVDTRVTLDPVVFAEVRALSIHPEVVRFAGAQGPARAPQYDGVAAEVTLPAQAPILVDGVREVAGKMGRLLDLDRDLALRYGAAASACE